MQTNRPEMSAPLSEEPADFSLVLGGPLFQLLRRARLSDDALILVNRRIIAGLLITWLPLLLLSASEGRAWWGSVAVPFLLNAEVHTRFLLALPLLLVAELTIHVRMRRLLGQFAARNLVADQDWPRVHAAIESAMRLRNSLAAELLLIVLILASGSRCGSTSPSKRRAPGRRCRLVAAPGLAICRSPAGGRRW